MWQNPNPSPSPSPSPNPTPKPKPKPNAVTLSLTLSLSLSLTLPLTPRRRAAVTYCVTGQARGFNPVRELGRALAGGDDVDVFAVIEADCMPHFCSGDVLGRIKRWLHEEGVERAIITVNGTYAASSSMEARSSNVGVFAEPPSVPAAARSVRK